MSTPQAQMQTEIGWLHLRPSKGAGSLPSVSTSGPHLTVRQRDSLDGEEPYLPPVPLCVVLDNLRSAFNVGSIFRTCEGAGVEQLYLCGITPYPPHEKLEKTARGATSLVRWSHHVDTLDAVRSLRERGYAIAACELTDRSVDYRSVPYPKPLALVLGHEVAGVARPSLEVADWIIEIPMRGRKNSLNVATTCGIVVFEILRQWEASGGAFQR